MRHLERIGAVFLLAAAMFAAPAQAAEEYPDRWMFRLGGYSVRDAQSIIRLDANNAPAGVFIDFQETLGGDDSANVGRLDGLYRINDQHGIGFSWYALKFNGHKTIDRDITWGDQTFTAGATLDSEIKFDVYKVNYQYSLYHKEEVELGAQIGLHVMGTSAALSAVGLSQSRGESVTAPLPVWGVFANYNFTPRLSTYFNYQFFFVSYESKVKGGLQDLLFGLEYRLSRHFAVGTAFNRFGVNLEAKDEDATLHFNTIWTGMMLYGSLYF